MNGKMLKFFLFFSSFGSLLLLLRCCIVKSIRFICSFYPTIFDGIKNFNKKTSFIAMFAEFHCIIKILICQIKIVHMVNYRWLCQYEKEKNCNRNNWILILIGADSNSFFGVNIEPQKVAPNHYNISSVGLFLSCQAIDSFVLLEQSILFKFFRKNYEIFLHDVLMCFE